MTEGKMHENLLKFEEPIDAPSQDIIGDVSHKGFSSKK